MRRVLRQLGLAAFVLVLVPASASAACTKAQRADVRGAVAAVDALRAANSPGAVDMTAVLTRARRSCGDARFARAAAEATRTRGVPVVGRRLRIRNVDLIGTTIGGGVAWRFDVVRAATRLAGAKTDRSAATLRAIVRSAGSGSRSIVWGDDPTRPKWDPDRQSRVVASLARSSRPTERRLAGAGVRAYAPAVRLRTLTKLDLIDHLRAANRIAYARDRSGLPAARTASRAVALRAEIRVRAAQVRGWSRISGTWSTLERHRQLVAQARALVRREPHPATQEAVAKLAAALTSAPTLDFSTLPTAAFYPWPRDGAFDSQSVVVDPDKPVTATLSVYGIDSDVVVRTVAATLLPGDGTLAWDGTGLDGATLGAGEYRYNVDLVDLAGNTVRVPGLEAFTIARDTTPPKVESASARHVSTGGQGRLIVSWNVEEVYSPKVTSSLLLQRGNTQRRVQLHDSSQAATVRRDISLSAGTWTVTFFFLDGSGNRVQHDGGTLVVR